MATQPTEGRKLKTQVEVREPLYPMLFDYLHQLPEGARAEAMRALATEALAQRKGGLPMPRPTGASPEEAVPSPTRPSAAQQSPAEGSPPPRRAATPDRSTAPPQTAPAIMPGVLPMATLRGHIPRS